MQSTFLSFQASSAFVRQLPVLQTDSAVQGRMAKRFSESAKTQILSVPFLGACAAVFEMTCYNSWCNVNLLGVGIDFMHDTLAQRGFWPVFLAGACLCTCGLMGGLMSTLSQSGTTFVFFRLILARTNIWPFQPGPNTKLHLRTNIATQFAPG